MTDELKIRQFEDKLRIRGYSEVTIYGARNTVRQFIAYLRERENVSSLLELEPKHIKSYHAYLTFEKSGKAWPRNGNKHYLTQGTKKNRLTILQTFFRVMHQENLLPHDFSGYIVTPKKLVHLPKDIPSQDEMRTLIQSILPDTPLGIRDRFMFELMYATGIRNTELRTLKIHDMNIHDKTLFISGKGGAERIVPIGEWVVPYAKEYLNRGRHHLTRLTKTDLLFPTRRGNEIDTSMLDKIVKFYCWKAGIQTRISPHTFRHACATHMLQAGADIRYVQELLGHRDLGCTAIYTKVTIGDLRKAHAKYHPANRDDF